MAKVIVDITAFGKMSIEVDDLHLLEKLSQHSASDYLDASPLCKILHIPAPLDILHWEFKNLSITNDDKEIIVHNQVLLTKEEYHLLMSSFGHRGSCGCDGAVDFGCPLCTPSKTKGWKEELDKLKAKLR